MLLTLNSSSGGKETPLASARGAQPFRRKGVLAVLPPRPPILPPTRFLKGETGHVASDFQRSCMVLEHFQFETLCVSNHTACRFAEKRGFSAHFGPGGAVPPSWTISVFQHRYGVPAVRQAENVSCRSAVQAGMRTLKARCFVVFFCGSGQLFLFFFLLLSAAAAAGA